MPEMLIQSQQVTLTGTVERVSLLLRVLDLDQNYWGVTVTIHTPSVTDATVGVTQDSQQNPRQRIDDLLLRWNRAAASVGICGSEFVDDPERVFEAVRANRDAIMNALRRCKADAQGSVTEQSQQKSRQRWTKDVPVEQGDYWHWNGNPDCAPFILQIMWSGTAQKCYVSIRDVPGAPFCDEYGGWWMRIQQPQTPDLDATVGVTWSHDKEKA